MPSNLSSHECHELAPRVDSQPSSVHASPATIPRPTMGGTSTLCVRERRKLRGAFTLPFEKNVSVKASRSKVYASLHFPLKGKAFGVNCVAGGLQHRVARC